MAFKEWKFYLPVTETLQVSKGLLATFVVSSSWGWSITMKNSRSQRLWGIKNKSNHPMSTYSVPRSVLSVAHKSSQLILFNPTFFWSFIHQTSVYCMPVGSEALFQGNGDTESTGWISKSHSEVGGGKSYRNNWLGERGPGILEWSRDGAEDLIGKVHCNKRKESKRLSHAICWKKKNIGRRNHPGFGLS